MIPETKPVQLKDRHMISLRDYSREEIIHILDFAIDLKKRHKADEVYQPMKGKPEPSALITARSRHSDAPRTVAP